MTDEQAKRASLHITMEWWLKTHYRLAFFAPEPSLARASRPMMARMSVPPVILVSANPQSS
jgi:hypothetical protein